MPLGRVCLGDAVFTGTTSLPRLIGLYPPPAKILRLVAAKQRSDSPDGGYRSR